MSGATIYRAGSISDASEASATLRANRVTAEPIAPAMNEVTRGASRRHHVHVYTVIRVKIAVEAPDHRRAMVAAAKLLFANGWRSGWCP